MTFTFVDLFAGVGGFHAALGGRHLLSAHSGLGGECVFACELDRKAAAVYQANWGLDPDADIIPLTSPQVASKIPTHDVLCGGFPCQPFSKSGKQLGMHEARGTLFYNICKILDARKPPLVLLENVRNIAGPRHRDDWDRMIGLMRFLGYRVSAEPVVFSPHLLPPSMNGSPQVRERVFIAGTYIGAEAVSHTDLGPLLAPRAVLGWNPLDWKLEHVLEDETDIDNIDQYRITERDQRIIQVWNDFLKCIPADEKLPGFPVWADALVSEPDISGPIEPWRANFLKKNSALFNRHQSELTKWLKVNDHLADLKPSRRKFEWQAQNSVRDLYHCLIHFRPSGIRVKQPTYFPALVAINQTSIVGPRRRRITPREAAVLQGFPRSFSFGGQPDALSYKQMGNAVAVGAVQHAFKALVTRDAEYIRRLHPTLYPKVQQFIDERTLLGTQAALGDVEENSLATAA